MGSIELHVGEAGAAGRRACGEEPEARRSPQAAPATPPARHAAASGRQPPSVVPGRALVRPAGDADDATSEIYYAQLVEEESTVTVMAALREVIERRGLFCALYSDRGSHFWLTPKAGGKVDVHRLTQVGRALRDLGVQMIPAYSPQARGRSERSFSTWQGRLPQELRLRGIRTVEEANRFLHDEYITAFNRRFQVPATQRGTAFTACPRRDLDLIFAAIRTFGQPRQHGQFSEPRAADRSGQLAWHPRRMQCDGASTPRWNPHPDLWTTPAWPLHGRWTARISNHDGNQTEGGQDGGSAALEIAPRFPLLHPPGGCTRLNRNRTDHVLQKADVFTC